MPDAIGGYRFPSRRSAVPARRAMLATSRPLAATAGLRIFAAGGNAFDAAVAAAAALAVVDPLSTGIGGDGFALCWTPTSGGVQALNASGRAPLAADADEYARRFGEKVPRQGIHSVTVPGVVDGWARLLDRFGSMPLSRLLEPAIEYAEEGFPVPEILARQWEDATPRLVVHPNTARVLLPAGRAPRSGELFRNPELGRTLRLIAEGGPEALYRGPIAEQIVAFSRAEGGVFTLEDFHGHRSEWVEPIHVDYRGSEVYQCPPNGQGLVVLLALNVLAGYELGAMEWGSAEHLHRLIEAVKLAFADGHARVCDPATAAIPLPALLSRQYAARRRALIDPERAGSFGPGDPAGESTIYVAAADDRGNVCSLINSLSLGFGSGLVAGSTGVCLQNRGSGFVLEPGHPNRLAGGKRPFHTIIPAMVLREGRPWLCYGLVGGAMQPPGHVELLSNLIDFGMGPQEALDAPRVRIGRDGQVAVEPGYQPAVLAELRRRGHPIEEDLPMTLTYGGGQLVMVDPRTGVLTGASEPRWDGMALGL